MRFTNIAALRMYQAAKTFYKGMVVYHTERDGRTRIISARQAEKKLQEVYYDFIKKING